MTTCLAPNGPTVYRSAAPPAQLLVATTDGVMTLERQGAGQAWEVTRQSLPGLHIASLVSEPRRGALFAGLHGREAYGNRGGLYGSFDGGATWEPRMDGLTEEDIFILSCCERDGQVLLYAGTEPAKLFVSDDYGAHWRELPPLEQAGGSDRWRFPVPPHTPHVKDIAFDPRDSRVMYVTVEQGALLKSTDGGETWRELDGYSKPEDASYKDIHRFTFLPSNPDVLYITGGEGLYYTADGGATFQHLTTTGMRIGYPDGFLISPDERTMFMSGGRRVPGRWRETQDADAAIARSRDGGRNWEILTGGLPEHSPDNYEAMSMCVWPSGYTIVAGTTAGEVWLSEDEGDTWTRIMDGLAPVSKDGHHKILQRPAVGTRTVAR